ncbi:hypothetical protein A1O1_03018 [Capronia coronata CBS 617.96]|uniref:Frequency clock protein n=1 Tax=Capronia coronata CBS 617.96 TaxID=1182541 RepID=W9YNV5_9EURO|nr:uncharacterized protein A1O1_03018 [Capronia coronata CBS 617.96]EXJ94622.1 hypothetical protein A1O1_03018 [Capronia coronata CBS 617.96]
MVDEPTSIAPSPKRSFVEISDNPRRTSPSQSKSLPRHKKVKTAHGSDGSIAGPVQPEAVAETSSTAPAAVERESSSDQSAEKWFKRANENVNGPAKKPEKREGGRHYPSSALWYANDGLDESPFYMSRQNRYQPPNHLRSVNAESFGGYLAKDDTVADELREVIDDLTVQNKKLKTLLRTRQPQESPGSSDSERVIEVRTHGLPPEKKRELEELLKNFSTSLTGDKPARQSHSTPVDESATSSGNGGASAAKLPHMDLTHHTDSGYASMSNSALNSTSYSGVPNDTDSKSKKDTDIKNYLHDIPDSLFPQKSLSVSDSAKMDMVVQRLEQLFTGKLALPGDHSLPDQQQKISRSAAKADRREDEKMNRASRAEGTREAHVFPPDSKINLDAIDPQRLGHQGGYAASSSGTPKSNTDVPGTPDQRPTRPLDLDIHRAQVASDNIRYIQHLGFSSPQVGSGAAGHAQPWMYLNLLVSMAQLHTLNVTPAFVRKAVQSMSTKFELSKDGHKIRWKGDASTGGAWPAPGSPMALLARNLDAMGEDGGTQRGGRSATSTVNDGTPVSLTDDRGPQEMMSTTSKRQDSTTSSSNLAVGKPSTLSKTPSSFDYRPLVYHKKTRNSNSLIPQKSYLDSSSSSGDLSPDSTGLAHVLGRPTLGQSTEFRPGFLTFFSNPYFFVDLSGDKTPAASKSDVHSCSEGFLGTPEQPAGVDDTLRDASACYFIQQSDGGQSDNLVAQFRCPDLHWHISPITAAGEDETQPIELPASGIGGVIPEDNFALDVKIERVRLQCPATGITGTRKPSLYAYRVIQCTKLELQPPRLPPPSYVFFTSSSSSGEQDYLEADASSETSDADESPALAGYLWKWSSSSSNERRAGEDLSEDSSLGALQAARARSANAEGGRAEDLDILTTQTGATVNGSLAATAGASYSAASLADAERVGGGEVSLSGMDFE